MKFTKLSFLALFVAILFLGCGNGDDDGPAPKLDPEGDCMTATIDGEFFNGEDVKVTALPVGESITLSGIINNLTDGEIKTLTINIVRTTTEGPIPVGTYALEDSFGNLTGQYVDGPIIMANNHAYTMGTLVILTHDTTAKRIEGEFSLEGEDADGNASSITDGYFDIKY